MEEKKATSAYACEECATTQDMKSRKERHKLLRMSHLARIRENNASEKIEDMGDQIEAQRRRQKETTNDLNGAVASGDGFLPSPSVEQIRSKSSSSRSS